MAQIICIGASIMYGVGGSEGGWPDYLKRDLHRQMFAVDGSAERHEIYNFSKSGVTVEFAVNNLEWIIKNYARKGQPIVLAFTIGSNNARAHGKSDGFVSTPKEFSEQINELLTKAKELTPAVLITGLPPVDEQVLNPKKNPWDGTNSYFYNDRLAKFDSIIQQSAEEVGAICVPLFDYAMRLDWQQEYLFRDGLHPNTAGHQKIYERVWPELDKILT
jgi:lysophospholipase L1-like esterase